MNNIQRTFLVSVDIKRWMKEYQYKEHKSEHFYVNNDEKEYYLKEFPDSYAHIVFSENTQIQKHILTQKEYETQRIKHIGRLILKKSYTLSVGDETFVLHQYLKKLKELYILIGHFKNEKAVRESKTLEILQPFVIKEIDQDKKYSDYMLATSIKPMEYSVQKLFEKIDAFEAPNLFFWQVPKRVYIRDGIALILYRNIRLLNHYKVSFQKKHFASTLHRLRVILRRTATLLETFEDLFNPNVQKFCRDMLTRYYEETKVLRYLYFLDELCTTRDDIKLTLYSELKSLIIEEEKEVMQMLLSQPFVQMINILMREIEIQENQQYISLKQRVKEEIKQRLKALEVLLSETQNEYDEHTLEKLYNTIDALQTLIEDFFHIIGQKETQVIVDELNILLKPLREYRNCKEREVILIALKEQSQNKILDIDPLLCVHEVELKEKINNALKLLRTSKFHV